MSSIEEIRSIMSVYYDSQVMEEGVFTKPIPKSALDVIMSHLDHANLQNIVTLNKKWKNLTIKYAEWKEVTSLTRFISESIQFLTEIGNNRYQEQINLLTEVRREISQIGNEIPSSSLSEVKQTIVEKLEIIDNILITVSERDKTQMINRLAETSALPSSWVSSSADDSDDDEDDENDDFENMNPDAIDLYFKLFVDEDLSPKTSLEVATTSSSNSGTLTTGAGGILDFLSDHVYLSDEAKMAIAQAGPGLAAVDTLSAILPIELKRDEILVKGYAREVCKPKPPEVTARIPQGMTIEEVEDEDEENMAPAAGKASSVKKEKTSSVTDVKGKQPMKEDEEIAINGQQNLWNESSSWEVSNAPQSVATTSSSQIQAIPNQGTINSFYELASDNTEIIANIFQKKDAILKKFMKRVKKGAIKKAIDNLNNSTLVNNGVIGSIAVQGLMQLGFETSEIVRNILLLREPFQKDAFVELVSSLLTSSKIDEALNYINYIPLDFDRRPFIVVDLIDKLLDENYIEEMNIAELVPVLTQVQELVNTIINHDTQRMIANNKYLLGCVKLSLKQYDRDEAMRYADLIEEPLMRAKAFGVIRKVEERIQYACEVMEDASKASTSSSSSSSSSSSGKRLLKEEDNANDIDRSTAKKAKTEE